jgi:flagellar motility protein MotE (MotC chaperone)
MKIGVKKRIFAVVVVFFFSGSGIFLLNAADLPVTISPDTIEKSVSLQQREEAVSAREKKLDQRAKELDAVKKEVDGKLEQIAALQKDVEEKLAAIKQEQDASFKNLIKVYSAMSPSKLGPLLNLMTDDNVAKVLRAMKAEQVALIMPKLDSEKAVKVSRLLGRFE